LAGSGALAASQPPAEKVFHFTAYMRRLCEDMIVRTPALSHICLSQVMIAFAQARRGGLYGTYASLTPLRFENGAFEGVKQGRRYRVNRYLYGGRELLYILSFYMPRFMNIEFREKLITVFHELWHIGPKFDGDFRRFPGGFHLHSKSQSAYDEEMGRLADAWLAQQPDETLFSDLRGNFAQLQTSRGRVIGDKFARPRLIPVV
jgi:hypothetical protein